jgi:hypothetical protein
LLPNAKLALELEGKLLWRSGWGFALAARYVTESTRTDSDGRGLIVHAAGGQSSALYRINPYWEASLGAALYRLAGTGVGPGAREGSAWAAGPSAGVAFVPFQHERIWLALAGELHWNAYRPTFEFENHGPIFSPSLFDVSIFIRVGPRFH